MTRRTSLLGSFIHAVASAIVALGCMAALLAAVPAPVEASEVTVTGDNATHYLAYKVFSCDVSDGKATNAAWESDAARKAAAQAGAPTQTAQDAADWMGQNLSDGSPAAYSLARALMASDADATHVTAGKPATLSAGYWLIVADESRLGESQSGTAPVFVLLGRGASKTITPKSAIPTVAKHVRENSTAAWRKAADATVGDDVLWRLEATVPAGTQGYASYDVEFADQMSAGLDPGKVASTARVYLRAGTGSAWAASTEAADTTAKGWTDITSSCTIEVEGQGFTVKSPDVVSLLGAEAFASKGAQLCVIYNAPLNQRCNHGAAKGNPNEVYLRYPASPLGHGSYLSTPKDDATAYTWDVRLTKRSSSGDEPLSGAVLSVTDPQGRHLVQDGGWSKDASTVTTDGNGRVTLSGVDSGTYKVTEVRAPKGYQRIEGSRRLVLKVAGLDVAQVASARPTLTISAESPLRADSVDGSTSLVHASLINTPTPPGVTPPGGTAVVKTGDPNNLATAVAATLVGCGLVVMGLKVRKKRQEGHS